MTLGTVYRLNAITLDKVKSLLDKYEASKTLIDNNKPYVIVIDEFNRGNVSKIFGELITLLEPDKRKGMRNAESVLLPYSKKEFYIPSNVFLVATMNTADRSLDTIDYAIRRRFAFITVKPQEIDDDNFNSELIVVVLFQRFSLCQNLFTSHFTRSFHFAPFAGRTPGTFSVSAAASSESSPHISRQLNLLSPVQTARI